MAPFRGILPLLNENKFSGNFAELETAAVRPVPGIVADRALGAGTIPPEQGTGGTAAELETAAVRPVPGIVADRALGAGTIPPEQGTGGTAAELE